MRAVSRILRIEPLLESIAMPATVRPPLVEVTIVDPHEDPFGRDVEIVAAAPRMKPKPARSVFRTLLRVALWCVVGWFALSVLLWSGLAFVFILHEWTK